MKELLRFPLFIITILIGLTLVPLLYAEEIEIPLDKLIYDEWYGMYEKGEKIGYVHLKSHPFAEDGEEYFLIEEEMKMFISVGTRKAWRKFVDCVHYSKKENWRRVYASSVTVNSLERLITFTECLKGSEYEVSSEYLGGRQTWTASQPDETLSDAFRVQLDCIRGVQSGHKGEFLEWNINKLEDETSTYEFKKIEEEIVNGIRSRIAMVQVVNPEGDSTERIYEIGKGRLLEEKDEDGISLKLETKEEATDPSKMQFRISDDINIYTDTEIKKSVYTTISRCKLFLSGVIAEDMPNSDRATYKNVDNGLEIEVSCEAFNPNNQKKKDGILKDPQLFLREEPLIQCDNLEIIECSKRILKDLETPYAKSLFINDWVYRFVEHSREEYSDALRTLRNKKGNCTAKANLAVALSRAAAIPAQSVGGIVYTTDPPKTFGMHAWAKYYINGEWVEMDPSTGMNAVDATYIEMPMEVNCILLGKTIKVLDLKEAEKSIWDQRDLRPTPVQTR